VTLYEDLEAVLNAVSADIDRLHAVRSKLYEAIEALDPPDPEAWLAMGGSLTPKLAAVPDAPKTRKPGGGRKPKHDWMAIGEVARNAQGAGLPIAATLAAEFGANSTTAAWMVKRCRELGHLEPSQRFTSEPITRTEVNEQAARERAAAAL
jgi:hypothetical protein